MSSIKILSYQTYKLLLEEEKADNTPQKILDFLNHYYKIFKANGNKDRTLGDLNFKKYEELYKIDKKIGLRAYLVDEYFKKNGSLYSWKDIGMMPSLENAEYDYKEYLKTKKTTKSENPRPYTKREISKKQKNKVSDIPTTPIIPSNLKLIKKEMLDLESTRIVTKHRIKNLLKILKRKFHGNPNVPLNDDEIDIKKLYRLVNLDTNTILCSVLDKELFAKHGNEYYFLLAAVDVTDMIADELFNKHSAYVRSFYEKGKQKEVQNPKPRRTDASGMGTDIKDMTPIEIAKYIAMKNKDNKTFITIKKKNEPVSTDIKKEEIPFVFTQEPAKKIAFDETPEEIPSDKIVDEPKKEPKDNNRLIKNVLDYFNYYYDLFKDDPDKKLSIKDLKFNEIRKKYGLNNNLEMYARKVGFMKYANEDNYTFILTDNPPVFKDAKEAYDNYVEYMKLSELNKKSKKIISINAPFTPSVTTENPVDDKSPEFDEMPVIFEVTPVPDEVPTMPSGIDLEQPVDADIKKIEKTFDIDLSDILKIKDLKKRKKSILSRIRKSRKRYSTISIKQKIRMFSKKGPWHKEGYVYVPDENGTGIFEKINN